MTGNLRRLAALDPRYYQISVLAGLLVYGVLRLDLEVQPAQAATALATVLAAQALANRLVGRPSLDILSALISGLSLCLLLRTSSVPVAVLAAVITIASKFILRWNGKHIFNPTNLGITATILLTGQAWVSPGQWGSAAFFTALVALAGALVVTRAARADLVLAYIGAYSALLAARTLWLGDPWSIPLHQLENGALVIFAFYMISDPRTTPDSRIGRLLFALLVALGTYYSRFMLYRPDAALWALVLCSPLTPLIDRLLPGRRFEWRPLQSVPKLPTREVLLP